MASSTGLREAGRHIRITHIPIHLRVTRQYSSFPSLIRNSTSRPKQSSHSFAYTYSHQSRSFSLWGSGSAAKPAQTDVPVIEPATIERTRAVQASHDTSDSLASVPPQPTVEAHPPTPIEPQFVENIQNELARPSHFDPSQIADVPERLGYLKDICGLDFGWGPTAFMQWSLEHLHIVAGCSWATSCVLLGVIMRASIMPLMIGAAKETAKLREITPLTKPLMEQLQASRATGDRKRAMELQKDIQTIRKNYNVKFYKAFLPVIIQLPLGFGAWRILRNAATLPVPGFITESWLWTSDLTFSDPYFIMPALGGALVYLTMKTNKAANRTAAGMDSTQGHFMSMMMKVFPFITVIFVAIQPGAVQLYIVSSSVVGYLTAATIANSSFRKAVKLPPLPTADAPPTVGIAGAAVTSAKPTNVNDVAGLRVRRNHVHVAKLSTETETPQRSIRSPDRSIIDKIVDAGKDEWSSIKTHGKGMVSSVTGSKELAEKKKSTADRKREQAQYRADFEAVRKEKEQNRLGQRKSSKAKGDDTTV